MSVIDKSYRENFHRKVIGYIDSEELKKRNKAKSWAYGYDPIYNMVVVSKDGTVGEVLEINNLLIAIPAQPDKIRWNKLKPEHQKWERYEVPEDLSDFDFLYGGEKDVDKKLEEIFEKHENYISEDDYKINNGDWFFNDTEAIYITGSHYFFLQWYKLTDGDVYADFRMPQRDYFLWLEACYADTRCYGSLLLKSRRSSFTVTASSEIIRDAISNRNGFYPVVSKTNADSDSLFQDHIAVPITQLPKHLQPERTGNVLPKKEVHFTSNQRKITTNNKVINSNIGLNSRIKTFPTTMNSYDGKASRKSLNDEIGKFEFDINLFWNDGHKKCHQKGSIITGKAICGSTANPLKDGGENYKKFFESSNILNRDANGRTVTGLYAIFIPADFSTSGFFDEWGYVIYHDPEYPVKNEVGELKTIGVVTYLDNIEKSLLYDEQLYNSQKRTEPRKVADAFLDADNPSMFGKKNVSDHIHFLDDFQKTEKYREKYYSIDLYWKDGIQDTTVIHRENPKGKYKIGWLPPKEERNLFTIKNGRKYPVNGHIGAFGCDPYRTAKVAYGSGSKMAFLGLTKPEGDGFPKNNFFLYYCGRARTIDEAVDDVIKAMVFFSMPILCEQNVSVLLEKIRERGYRGYSLNDPTLLRSEYKPNDTLIGGQISSPRTTPKQEISLDSFIENRLPREINEDDIKVPFVEILKDWEKYDPTNRTKRDLTIASMMATQANQMKFTKVQKQENNISENEFMSLFEVKHQFEY